MQCRRHRDPSGHLSFPPQFPDRADYYNNHYFTSPNERHIIGPFVATDRQGCARPAVGEITCVVAQTFTRISYDVPAKYKREL